MKKISLKNLNLKEVDQLSREQLKNVMGGFTGGTDDGSGTTTTTEAPPCPDDKPKCTVNGTTSCLTKYECCREAGYSDAYCKTWG